MSELDNRQSLSIRPAVMSDLPFIDALQKIHTHMVGWMPTKQLEGKIGKGHVLVAESGKSLNSECRILKEDVSVAPVSFQNSSFRTQNSPTQVGYVIGNDQYSGRDDIGIIYQLNVQPSRQRGAVGRALIEALFARAAYGCKLYCCWCAQDIQANHFWESVGFVPLAFRTGSRSKQRTHIFWQCRIDRNDRVTPWWYPAQTKAGAIREDRIVLPIPLDTHWREAKPIVLPGMESPQSRDAVIEERHAGTKALRHEVRALARVERPVAPQQPKTMAVVRSRHLMSLPPGKAAVISSGRLQYVDRADAPPEPVEAPKPKRSRKPAVKSDPRLVHAVRELRDRYLEQINQAGALEPHGKYLIGRGTAVEITRLDQPTLLLEAA